MRARTIRRVLAFTVVLTLVSVPAIAQNLVRGTVLDGDKNPVVGALIQFEAIEFVNKRETKTDKRGEFLYQGLPSGEYKITVTKDGFTDSVKYRVHAESSKERVNFTLAATPKPRVTGPPGLESLGDDAKAVAKGKELTEVQALATAAVAAQRAGQHEDAVAKFSELVAKVPNCADCYIQLGVSNLSLKRYDEAEANFKKSNEVKPSVEAYTALAQIYNFQKKTDLAAEASSKATELASRPPEQVPAAGVGPGGDAAKPTVVVKSSPEVTSDTLYNQGVILWNSGKYAEARTQFEAAVKANPSNALAHYQLGMANLNAGLIPAARAAFEAYLKVAPEGPRATEVKGILTELRKQK
jgi:tetratricopeptide (TPR) repeat protein